MDVIMGGTTKCATTILSPSLTSVSMNPARNELGINIYIFLCIHTYFTSGNTNIVTADKLANANKVKHIIIQFPSREK